MTTDERLESLVSSFGQTISDLPKADASEYAYSREHLGSANMAAWRWHENQHGISMNLDCEDYICHLADVIDRMEAALETARRWMGCEMCGRSGSCQKVTDYEVDNGFIRDCDDFRIKDWFLEGV